MMNGIEEYEWLSGFGLFWWVFGIAIFIGFTWLMITTLEGMEKDRELPFNDSTLDRLKDKYAKGEISKEQFDERSNKQVQEMSGDEYLS